MTIALILAAAILVVALALRARGRRRSPVVHWLSQGRRACEGGRRGDGDSEEPERVTCALCKVALMLSGRR